MLKKFLISTIVTFIAAMLLSFLVHGFVLSSEYKQLTNLYRNDQEQSQYFGFLLLAYLIMSGALVWIYRFGKESKPFVIQGIRFGLAIAMVACVPTYLINFAVQPLPALLAAKQIVLDTGAMMALGVVVAFLER